MRLLNTSTLRLKEFIGHETPSYAILSHRWGEDEVLFDDIQNETASYKKKKGYSKVEGCCRKAAQDGFEWVWIDSCCINKSSSAELSEAINSMYLWYEQSAVCYAYLDDSLPNFIHLSTETIVDYVSDLFAVCSWFRRGWTLQELIAPRAVELYTSDWIEIPVRILLGEKPSTCSVAERMSRASRRETTRIEDSAYCLLGLSQVNMPLLYGEGNRSFLRLQEHILKQEEDYSIFAWTTPFSYTTIFQREAIGFLASGPSQFVYVFDDHEVNIDCPESYSQRDKDFFPRSRECFNLYENGYENIRKHDFDKSVATDIPKEPPTLTSRGLRVSLPVRYPDSPNLPPVAWIYCTTDDQLVCVLLQPAATATSRLTCRYESRGLVGISKSFLPEFTLTDLLLNPDGKVGMNEASTRTGFVHIQTAGDIEGYNEGINHVVSRYKVAEPGPYRRLRREENGIHEALLVHCIYRSRRVYSHFQVHCGIYDGYPWCSVIENSESQDTEVRVTLDHLQRDHGKLLSDFTDRDAKQSFRLPGIDLSASIRPGPVQEHIITDNGEEPLTTYTLCIKAHYGIGRETWVGLLLIRERQERYLRKRVGSSSPELNEPKKKKEN
ncbi:hypothetical protein FZEAL_9492 [Fusarium zealandicum]|uniref:Heterokaryon incompatibility domain-containing protein n=1 Tax=Fusarium zealandicum TaxID=1053134 RepID=A0A8H4UBA2_9HYPO|nr:hypothetical protein FZEAL_9492 [Fusarium zealandicum]